MLNCPIRFSLNNFNSKPLSFVYIYPFYIHMYISTLLTDTTTITQVKTDFKTTNVYITTFPERKKKEIYLGVS